MKKPYYFDAPLPLIVVKTVALLWVVVSAVLSVVLRNLHWGALNFFFIAVFFVTQGIQDKIRTDKATALIISVFGGCPVYRTGNCTSIAGQRQIAVNEKPRATVES